MKNKNPLLALFKRNLKTLLAIATLSLAPFSEAQTGWNKEKNIKAIEANIAQQKAEQRKIKFKQDSIDFHDRIFPILDKRWDRTLSSPKHASLVLDNEGRVLWQKNADEQRRPASMSKMMTAYIVFDKVSKGALCWDDRVMISKNAYRKIQPFRAWGRKRPRQNRKYDLRALTEGMMTLSCNTSATALAEHISGSEKDFGKLMTKTAKNLGMCQSSFSNPSGLPSLYNGRPTETDNLSTAKDIALLIQNTYAHFPENMNLLSIKKYKGFNHTARGVMDDHFIGAKTGYTRASGANMAVMIGDQVSDICSNNGHQYTIVVMGTNGAWGRNMLVKLFRNALEETFDMKAPIQANNPHFSQSRTL